MFRGILLVLIALVLAVFSLVVLDTPRSRAQTCPPGAASCKVIVVTPEQENVLDQLITQTCVQGPYAQIADLVKFYKEMLVKAPAGTVAEKLPEQPKK